MNLTKQDRVSLQNLLGHFVHLIPEDAPIMPELKRLRDLVTPRKVGRKVGWRKPNTDVLPDNKVVVRMAELDNVQREIIGLPLENFLKHF